MGSSATLAPSARCVWMQKVVSLCRLCRINHDFPSTVSERGAKLAKVNRTVQLGFTAEAR